MKLNLLRGVTKTMYEFEKLIRNMPVTIGELIRLSGVHEQTLTRMRKGERVQRASAAKVLHALSEIYHKEYTLDNVTGIIIQE